MFDSIHWHVYGFKGIVDEITGFGIIGNILADMQVTPDVVTDVAAVAYAVLILITYFIGNISPSTILAKRQGLDIKKEGSGNAGTTNALRVMGKKAGVITLVIDILKGVLAVLLAEIIAGEACGMYCAVAVIIGHVWPVVYKFKGGKGVATTFGALVAINPMLGLWTLLVVAIVTFLSKRMSAGSIAGAVCFPIICLFNEPEFIVHGTLLAFIVLIKHRANIVRLLEGEEPKLGFLDKDKKDEDEGAVQDETVTEPEAEENEAPVGETAEQPAAEPEEDTAAEQPDEEPAEEPEAEAAEVQTEETGSAEEKADKEQAEEPAQDSGSEPEAEEQAEEPEKPVEEAEETDEAPAAETEPAEQEAKPEKYKRPAVDKTAKKNGKKKKSYPNKHKNGGQNKNNKGSQKNSKSKGKGNKGKSKKKGGKKK